MAAMHVFDYIDPFPGFPIGTHVPAVFTLGFGPMGGKEEKNSSLKGHDALDGQPYLTLINGRPC